jgi:pilus assembly protein FimV
MNIRIYLYVVCLFAGLYMSAAQALLLTDIQLNSYLNQTLDARIGMSGLKAGDLERLTVRLHNVDGMPDIITAKLKVEVMEEGNGHYIHLTSSEKIREPLLAFSLELVWPEGRLIREYTLFVDPPQ